MENYLKMHKRQQVIALLELGWTYRRIEADRGRVVEIAHLGGLHHHYQRAAA